MPYLFCDNDAFVDNISESKYNNLNKGIFTHYVDGEDIQEGATMKKCVSLILIIALILGVVVLATSCDKTKGTPVYEGMTIVRYGGGAAYSAAENTVAQTDEEINDDFVNEDGGELEKPVDEVVTIVVNGSEKVEYFVMAGEVFTVQVHLSNPDNFEIQSFTLNGKKYANYMFKEGSDMELLLLDVTAPSTPGRFELTIDAIKYIDGSDIKDVRMDGERTIKAGVMYTSMPIAVVRDVAVTQNVASMNVTVLDADGLVAANGVKMYLTQGDNIVAEKVLSPGVNDVTFENLVMDTTYGYGVVSTFDRFDGNGKVAHWLTEGSFSTGKAFRVTSVAAGKDYVDFTYERSIDTGVLTAIKLLDSQNRELAVLQSTDEPTFAGLLSGVTYKIKLEFTYELNGETRNGESVVSFNTVAKTVPVVSIEDITSTSADMTFGLNIADKDSILSLDKIVLLEGDTEVEQFSVGDGYSASGLKSGTLYTIKVEYSYDLNDGNGVQKKTVSVDYPTLAASIAVEDIILLNTNVVKIGEELNMRIYFSNSSKIEMTDIYVNGIKVQVVGGDRTSSAIVKFVPDETGLIDFTVDKVEYLFFGTKVSQKIDSDVSVTYPIYGDLQDVSYENVSASPYEYTGLGICFTFDNGENYVVYKINDSDNFIKLANNSYFVPSDAVSTVEYGYENYGHTTQVIGYSAVKHTVEGYTTVSTPEEFMAMTDGYYVLTQDLDMRNVQFETAVNFTGILDGGGHTVRGLTNVIDTSKSQYFNIFSSYWGDKGSVYDTKFTELYVSVDNSRGNSPVAVSPLGDVILYNCAVSGDVLANNAIYTGLNIAQSSVSYTINKTINGVSSTDKADSEGDIEKTPAVTYEDGAIIFTSSSGGKVFVGYYENTMTEFDASPYFVVGSNAFAYCNSVTSIKIPADMEVPYLDFSSCVIVCAEYSTDHNLNFDKSKLQTLVLSGSGEVSGFQYLEELREVTLKGNFTSIGEDAFRKCSSLASVTFGEGSQLATIGEYAFQDCSSLASITIPTGVTSIESYAFEGCSSLASITIPAGVTSIGNNAFYNCDNLTSVYYLGDIAGWCGISELYSLMSNYPALYINGAKVEGEFVIPEGVETIPDYAFYGQTGITSFTIPDSVTSIGDSAFDGCSGLTSITIPDSVTSIGNSAFYGCNSIIYAEYSKDIGISFDKSKLQTLVLSGSGEVSGFGGCTELREVILKGDFTSIGEDAFAGCSSLASITIPAGVTSIGNYAFQNCSSLASITIPAGVTSIGNSAFYNCDNLTSVYYLGDIAGWCGISDLSSLMSKGPVLYIGGKKVEGEVVIPAGVETISSYAFYEQTGITSFTIPDSVTSIVYRAFYGCSALANVYYLGDIAGWCGISGLGSLMSNYPALYINGAKVEGEVVIPDGVETIPDDAFYRQTGITSITIPAGVTSIGEYAFAGCSSLASVTFGEGSQLATIGEYTFYDCSSLASIVIPVGATNIGNHAFDDCSSLASITIPAGVTSIGESAFAGCNNLTSVYYLGDIAGWCGISGLRSLMKNSPALHINGVKVEGELVIPDGVETISSYAFYEQTGITSITIPAGVTSIGWDAFSGCSSLASITIPAGVTSIGMDAFSNCIGLTSIVIPNSVTRIEDWAFSGCYALESVYYDGTEGQWLKIDISDVANDYLTDADRYYYSETEPALNEDGSAYDGNYWRYADGVPTPWVYVSPTSENNDNI